MEDKQDIAKKIANANKAKASHLDLSNCNLATLPDEIFDLLFIETIDVSNNKIEKLSKNILNLPKLKEINLENNPLTSPPLEIANQGLAAIQNYFEELERIGTDYLYEAKLLIVGEGGAGKTSLMRKVIDENSELPKSDESTRGIDIKSFNFPIEKQKGTDFKINMWDFGGQEIYHATHQFFLTERSLYILVADSRNENTNFNFWLNLVELLSNNSPVIIFLNEKQDRVKDINEFWIKSRFANVVRILRGNLMTNRGLNQVVNEVKHQVQQLPHIGSPLPKVWKNIKNQLQGLNRNFILSDRYMKICKENGIEHTQQALLLSQYLHDLGIFLHFQDNPILKRMINLNPEWATSAVYSIIENEKIIANHGLFSIKDLKRIWNEPEYSLLSDELLELMKKFELCYQVNEDKYIAPQLLPYNSPIYNWDSENNITLKYNYEFMPKGILTRFTVRMSRYVENDFVWKSGVILKREEANAEIIEFYNNNEIRVRINGVGKNELLTLITEEFNLIHESYHRLNVSRLIPCICSECKNLDQPNFYSYSSLIRRIKKGKYTVECDVSYEDVSVKALISDVGISKKEGQEIINSVLKDFGIDFKKLTKGKDEE